jgi:hypothetical protein
MGESNQNSRQEQNFSAQEYRLMQELVQARLSQKQELEFESFDGYELPPRTQFSMLKKPAVSIKYGKITFNMACIRLFEGVQHIIPIVHKEKKRLAVVMCSEEESASVEWARKKADGTWVNKTITSLEFLENVFAVMNWNRSCRYKILGRIANSNSGLILLFDLEESIMFAPDKQEYKDPVTGEVKMRQAKYFPDEYKDHIGKSFSDYMEGRQMNLFEDFLGYQGDFSGESAPLENGQNKQGESAPVDENHLETPITVKEQEIAKQLGLESVSDEEICVSDKTIGVAPSAQSEWDHATQRELSEYLQEPEN